MSNQCPRDIYTEYLEIDKLLALQKPLSSGLTEHEEHFFIIVHQVYELWFKQIISDLESIFPILQAPANKQDLEIIVIRLRRINKIFKLLLQEFDVLETMSSLEFLNFRNSLGTMSGFQSYQFRVLEIKFGLRRGDRQLYGKCPYDHELKKDHQEKIQESESCDNFFGCFEKWLESLPYLSKGTYDFRKTYVEVFKSVMQKEKKLIQEKNDISESEKKELLRQLEEQYRSSFELLMFPEQYQELIDSGKRRLSYKAILSGLFIRLYRNHQILQLPDLILTEVIESNALFTSWRFRHCLMVQKMIGWKKGTGGSSGVNYLQETVEKHDVFADLYLIPTLMVPQPYIPPLPTNLLPENNLI